MGEVILTSTILNFVYLIVGFFGMWGALRVLDYATGVDFKDRLANMGDIASAIYFGARIVAIAIYCGLALS